MKKTLTLLLTVVVVSGAFAQEQNSDLNSTSAPGMIASGALVNGQVLTAADKGQTITLHVGDSLSVQLNNERHFISGDKQHGLEAVSTISFDGISNDGVLAMSSVNSEDGLILQDDRNFVATAVGQTKLSYKRMTRYIGYGNCPVPMCILDESISFNIVVVQ